MPPAFLSYLRADGIILPPEDSKSEYEASIDGAVGEGEDDDESDPSAAWAKTHAHIKASIQELAGSVMPKLNWSAPKDATWISATNSMECTTPNDIYLLLKSSDFIVHDLEQAFDGCVDQQQGSSPILEGNAGLGRSGQATEASQDIPYYLTLRKTIPAYNTSMEFRCFVRDRILLCMCQRDLNYYDFLRPMLPHLRNLIQEFFAQTLATSFPDPNFVFDVYIPSPQTKVWLTDINPWAPRTDPLLFSWLEILDMPSGMWNSEDQESSSDESEEGQPNSDGVEHHQRLDNNEDQNEGISVDIEAMFTPEFRVVNRDDPEAYSFNTPQYSAHKLPKDVFDASVEGEAGLRDFMGTWRELVKQQEQEKGTQHDDNIEIEDREN